MQADDGFAGYYFTVLFCVVSEKNTSAFFRNLNSDSVCQIESAVLGFGHAEILARERYTILASGVNSA